MTVLLYWKLGPCIDFEICFLFKGAAGKDGAPGQQGATGAQGSRGQTGEQGPEGIAGIQASKKHHDTNFLSFIRLLGVCIITEVLFIKSIQ